MPAIRHQARNKRRDTRVVVAAFEHDLRAQQERTIIDLRRRMIVGDDADPVLSSCPLDVMWARRVRGAGQLVFTVEHHMAGEWFLRLYRYRNGGCKLKGCLDTSQHSSSDTNPDNPHRDAQYLALATDPRLSPEAINTLANVIVFGVMPRWLSALIEGSSKLRRQREEFMRVMTTLRDIWLEYGNQNTEALQTLYRQQRNL